ncbi:MAG: signal peptidase I [Treponema sp.]|nr:signal peptidase I [Treponema sp.]
MGKSVKKADFFDNIQKITEDILTYRARKQYIKKEKQKAKKPLVDWLEAFLWAACMVLLLNQYLVQAYKIPTGSMINSLNIGDHVFVNKNIYGPELLPGFFKLPGLQQPKRNDVIVFESPDYVSRFSGWMGTAFDITQRIIFMLTLSLVDIDRNDQGEQRVHFLIKRTIGQGGDRLIFKDGDVYIKFAGEDRWVSEREYNAARGWKHNVSRLIKQDDYEAIAAFGKADGWSIAGFPVSQKLISQASSAVRNDSLAVYLSRNETVRKAMPHVKSYSNNLAASRLGWYVPEGRILPLGDNRDSSYDGREYGPVKVSKVLGKGLVIFWPFNRWGKII